MKRLLIAVVCTFSTISAMGQAISPSAAEIERRTDAIISKLTLQQKIAMIGGEGHFYIRAEPDAGLPRLKMADASVGVRNWGPSTAYPSSIALAASWDTDLAYKLGAAIGEDSRARGVNFILGPGVNIYRAPMSGRNFEYLGEDPFLASRLAVRWIEGVQSQGVSATVKHFALNNSEYDRMRSSSDADERTLREIYLPAFEAAVKEAHVGAIMDSYNLVNGVHSSQNDWLNNQIAKKDWGFNGIIMSDWGSSYDGVAEANGGLDLEMPDAQYMNEKTLLPAIAQRKINVAMIDDKVRRIVRTEVRFGFLDRPQEDLTIPLDSEHSRAVALQAAREGIVLLKNNHAVLPLNPATTCSVAVVGPDAWPAVASGGGSSHVSAFESIGILDGLSSFMAKRHASDSCAGVLYDRGLPTNSEFFQSTSFTSNGQDGLKQEIFPSQDFRGKPLESIVPHLTMQAVSRPAWTQGASGFSMRWTGDYLPAKTGKYLVFAETDRQGAYRLLVDGTLLLERKADRSEAPRWVEVDALAGKPLHVELDFIPSSAVAHGGLGIRSVNELVSDRAKAIAAKADAVIVAAGYDHGTEGEGFDRSFSLPWGQNELIQEMAALNKKTVVTINSGGGVDMMPWIAEIPAVLHLWYPGQEGGRALAEVLFGKIDPEGKLPISIEKRWADNPVYDSYYPTSGGETTEPHIKYSEGVFVGYRYYVSAHVKPLFPFGFGLSYTTFNFSDLEAASTQGIGDDVQISFDVRNSGHVAGAEVAQVYVGDPSASVKRPVEELKGFRKVRLAPGETAHVELQLDRRSFAYWSEKKHDWQVDPGKFAIMVGDSSEHLPLQTKIFIH